MKFATAAVVVLAVAMGVQSSAVYQSLGLGHGVSQLGLANGVGLGYNGVGLAYNGLAYNGLAYNGLGLNYGVAGLPIGVHGQHLVQENSWTGAPAAINIAHGYAPIAHAIAPQVTVATHAAVAQHAAIAAPIVGHGATYVAKNRGSIHTAPLPGHIQSAASINVAPAPGTEYGVQYPALVAPHAAIATPLVGHGATYVAKNRGSVHTAPLPGHVHSAASINVAPAPGTY